MSAMTKLKRDQTITVPAGEYILGDPCYCVDRGEIGQALWQELCRQWFGADWKKDAPVATIDGYMIIQFRTMYGDGCYYDQHGNEYGVDSGMIGLFPVEVAQSNRGGYRVRFEHPVECWKLRGVLLFGGYAIRTGGK